MASTATGEDLPNYDFSKLVEAHKALLQELYRIRNAIPASGASQEEINKWVGMIAGQNPTGFKTPEAENASPMANPSIAVGSLLDPVYEYVNSLINPIASRVSAVENHVANTLTEVRDKFTEKIIMVEQQLRQMENLLLHFEKKIKAKAWELTSFPVTLAKENIEARFNKIVAPVAAQLEGALHLFKAAYELESLQVLEIRQRLVWVGNSFAFLFKNEELKNVAKVFGDLFAEKSAMEDLKVLITQLAIKSNPMFAAIYWIVESVKKGELYVPDDLGFGLTPGRLYDFINHPGLEAGEREFRVELIAALDRYFHGEPDDATGSAHSMTRSVNRMDSKTSTQTLTDILRILLQTSFGFVFRLAHLPSVTIPKMSLLQAKQEIQQQMAAARHASATISRALSAPVKAISGLLLRGFWEVSSHNNALVELVSGFIAQTVGAIFESLIHSLYGLVEIREVYKDPGANKRCLLGWPTRATWGDKQHTYQAVVVRKGFLGIDEIENKLDAVFKGILGDEQNHGSILKSLLKDYGTYLELMQDFHEPDMTDESIKVSATKQKDGISVKAEFKDAETDLPIVLRVYASGNVAVMDRQYHADINCAVENIDTVHVFAGTHAHGSCAAKDIVMN